MSLNHINIKYFKMLNSSVIGGSNDLACSCHICGDSKTKRKKRLHLFTKDNVHDSVHCFNCGYSSSAYNYFKEFHSEYFSQYKLELNSQKLSSLKEIDLSEFKETIEQPISLDEFKKYFTKLSNDSLEYLTSRNFSKSDIEKMIVFEGKGVVELFGKKVNLNGFIVIPLINEDNLVYGYQARNIKEKKFLTIILKDYPKLWGLNTIKNTNQLYIFESIFDAVSSGFDSTLAVLGISSAKNILENYKEAVVFFDNQYLDEASKKTCLELAKLGYKIVIWDKNIKAKDVNELLNFLTKDEIQRIARTETYEALKAYIKLSEIR